MANATELVQVAASGRRLALTQRGTGAPTVVLETGLGAESVEWEAVQFWTTEWREPARNNEDVDFVASQAQAHTIGALGDIPMLVLTAGTFLREAPPGDPNAARIHLIWHELHRELMRQSSNAQQILVETSGHFIQREQPHVVVAAIQQMTRTVQQLKEITHVN